MSSTNGVGAFHGCSPTPSGPAPGKRTSAHSWSSAALIARPISSAVGAGIAAVEHPRPGSARSQTDQFGQVRHGGDVEPRSAAVSEHDHATPVEDALDEEP